jgi:hypothetical protein
MTKPDIPRRAYKLDLKVEADSLDSLIGYLRSFEANLQKGKIIRGVMGGYSAGSTYRLDVDETITHDAWAEANQRYVDWIVEEEQIEQRAQAIYDAMPFDGVGAREKPAWVPQGNSLKQDEARQLARAERKAEPVHRPCDCPVVWPVVRPQGLHRVVHVRANHLSERARPAPLPPRQ